jgi:tRNA pseudouridine55 synthase
MPRDFDRVLVLNKQVGETPLECINRFKESHSEYANVKMTYAGRLDPMAEGVLIVLTGEMVHKKEEFLKLPKTYECVAVLGVSTDTYDVLGLPSSYQEEGLGMEFVREMETKLQSFIGTFEQKYPPYSSKTINGKQMHTLAREGGLKI